ncbi:MAG TPA: endonuclease/exonuclease/phosphatase family protein [Ornithinibacter sp.]|nr:endonuclease/exonuclease/phosphatase family protein [Ornithinibacter sp.]
MRLRSGARLGLAAALALALPLAGTATGAGAQEKRELTVLTQNLYLGSSLNPALEATTGQDFVAAVAQIYGTMVFTDFPTRAGAIADTIAAEQPDLIGLQEVSSWIAVGLVPGATPRSYDFLEILQDELIARGLDYEVAAVSDNADIGPAPLVAPELGCGLPVPVPACVVTLQDRDVVLVNAATPGLSWSNPRDGSFAAQQTFQPPVGPPVSFDRGWASVDAVYLGKKFSFVNTHLEVEDSPLVQEAQAREFLAGPARGPAVVATGDFNSAADGSTTTSYADLTRSWFTDAWSVNPGQAGLTCCQNSSLTNPTSVLRSRIDLVLTHGAVRPLTATVVGDTRLGTTPPLWPSDHAGVVATVRLH